MEDNFLNKLYTKIQTHAPTPKIQGINTFKTSKTILSAEIDIIEPDTNITKEAMLFIIEDIILIYYKKKTAMYCPFNVYNIDKFIMAVSYPSAACF